MIRILPPLRAFAARFSRVRPGGPILANIAAGTHAGYVTLTAGTAFTSKYLLAMADSTPGEIDVCGAANCPVGIATDEADVGDILAMKLLGAGAQTCLAVAAGAFSAGAMLYTAANGQAQTEPATAGTYYLFGRALTAATAAGDLVEVETCLPVCLTVLAALSGDTGTQLTALAAAFSSPGMVKVL